MTVLHLWRAIDDIKHFKNLKKEKSVTHGNGVKLVRNDKICDGDVAGFHSGLIKSAADLTQEEERYAVRLDGVCESLEGLCIVSDKDRALAAAYNGNDGADDGIPSIDKPWSINLLKARSYINTQLLVQQTGFITFGSLPAWCRMDMKAGSDENMELYTRYNREKLNMLDGTQDAPLYSQQNPQDDDYSSSQE
jgi:hypothetical protein